MTIPTCQYYFIARTAFTNTETGEIEFKAIEKKFEDENPILAREAIFAYRNKFILAILTEGIGLSEEDIGWNSSEQKIENLSDRQIRKLINPYLELENEFSKTLLKTDDNEEIEVEWKAPDDSMFWYSKFKNGIWVIMRHTDIELHNQFLVDNDIVIDKVSRYEEPLPTPPNYLNLREEYEFYKKYELDTKSFETSFTFFDDEEFIDQGDAEEALKIINCLKTPFDWTGYDKIYWWDEKKYKNLKNELKQDTPIAKTNLPVTMEEAFNKGENEFCEFKPGLINRRSSGRDIEYEIARAICAFLNSKGGYLFIGIGNNGEIRGLDFSNISKDEFRREFTRIKTHYLPAFIAHTIYGDFYPDMENKKEVFIVTIYPSLNEPIFLYKKDVNSKSISKEFYVRSDAASRHIYDIETIVKICRDRWNKEL